MKEYTISANDAQARLDKFLMKAVPRLPAPLMQKYFRLKRIKVNGKRATGDLRLVEGDVVSLYINDEFFEQKHDAHPYLHLTPKLNIVYEDENILLVDKAPGMSVHEDANEKENTLINHILAYLYQNGTWDPKQENSFIPALCNRIDRNTGGIVIAAKNAPSLRVMNDKIKHRELKKYYLCAVHGTPNPPSGILEGYLFKDAVKNQVFVRKTSQPGAKYAATKYKVLKKSGTLSLVECELITGRTHQIRAQMAAAGHPLLGDGKYGRNELNQKFKRSYQALYSYKLTFAFTTSAGPLQYLNGRTFQVKEVPFAETYFG